MGRLVVITTPDLVLGFQLAGVETFAVESTAQAEAILRTLLEGGETSLIAVRQDLLQTIDPRLRRQLDTSSSPVVMAIPGGTPARPGEAHRQRIAALIRRAIGFHITFGAEAPRGSSAS
jgi:vacuolar-type H+-ATPase subunit F/Vma7